MREVLVRRRNQSGAVLVTGLFFLLVMTLVGVSTMKNISLEERISSNYREKMRAFEAAEMSLGIAHSHLRKQLDILPFYATGSSEQPGMYKEDVNPRWQDQSNWANSKSVAVNDDDNLPAGVALAQADLNTLDLGTAPRYMIGLKGETKLDGMDSSIGQKYYTFVVTSKASSKLPHIRSTLQAQVVEAH